MKTLFPLLLLALFSCGPDEATQVRLDKIDDRLVTLENAQTNNNTRLDQLEQEQTFQYKDIDSTKRALASVYVLTLEARGIALKVDSTVRVGRDRAGRRTETVMTALTYIPFLSQFIKKQ